MTSHTSAASVRSALVTALQADLVGPFEPASGHELLPVPPSRWYLTGFLAPQGQRLDDPGEDDELAAGDDDDGDLPPIEPGPKRTTFLPASIGLSVLLQPTELVKDAFDDDGEYVTATVTWADYTPQEPDTDDNGKKQKGIERTPWLRVPHAPVAVRVPLTVAGLLRGVEVPGSDGLVVMGKLGRGDAPRLLPGTRALSLFVVNRRAEVERRRADLVYAFQVSLELAWQPGLVARPNRQHDGADHVDDRIADLHYRDHAEYAVGHGVSVDVSADDDGVVRRAKTAWIPRAEVRRVETHESAAIESRMEKLAGLASVDDVRAALGALVDEYGAWIEGQAGIDVDSDERRKTRDELADEARRVKARIATGIDLVATNAEVRDAFCTMNAAMASQQRQRARTEAEKAREPRWRLFQLAFVLMNLPGIVDPHHDDRETVELIFFPTGGGKTEAYLGVIAFTVLLRRLRRRHLPDAGLGTAVILRYTLRLLTLDQLSRAASLMCALEVIRRGRPLELGEQRFTVGLWVGRKATANTLAEVSRRIVDFKNATSSLATSPFPLTKCPWCQHDIAKHSFDLRPKPSAPEDVVVACANADCPFSARRSPQGIPVLFVDEQVYRELPSFLVSTVDKFALVPWRGEAGRLFGRVSSRDDGRFFGPTDGRQRGAVVLPEGLLPPELIVQDELHLISGPLGTMVGLYETAVEQLSMTIIDGKPVKPKIIASTATVKRAREQIQALFCRPFASIFPPPGVDPGATFFSKVDTTHAGRLYIGVSAGGRSSKAAMLRVYAALLGAAQFHYRDKLPKDALADQPADAYMTLVGYFNALRELGGMRRLIEDEVRGRALTIEGRRPNDWGGPHPWARNRQIREPIELTSRESTGQIARTKALMERPWCDDEHADVVLASNMISVGVDIDRLGLMVVAGQPKSTNEYIQATSRVGRNVNRPGLVVTVFNPVKPRDRSHYERFAAYHQAFYRFVEATSVTPFSGPALQRGLAGLVVGMMRHGAPALTPPAGVMVVKQHPAVADTVVDALGARAAGYRRNVPHADAEKLRTVVRERARNLIDAWAKVVTQANQEGGGDRCYSPWDPGRKGRSLLYQSTERDQREDMTDDEEKFAAGSSMRDVEASVHLWVRRGPLGGKRPG
jgi:hypothetical protein